MVRLKEQTDRLEQRQKGQTNIEKLVLDWLEQGWVENGEGD